MINFYFSSSEMIEEISDDQMMSSLFPDQADSSHALSFMENSDIGITRETYRQGYTLIGFDVDPTTSPDFRYVGKPREGHTKLEIRFKNSLPSPVTVILYATFPEIMTIDQARNVRLEIKDKFAQRREHS